MRARRTKKTTKISRGIFITGADTSIGKTSIAAGLAFYLMRKKLNVGVMKPVQTGARPVRDSLLSGDALTLSLAANVRVSDSTTARVICPYSFPEPIAPLLASRKHRRPIRLRPIQKAFRENIKRHEFVIVEGAGGLLSPYSATLNSLTMALHLDLPLLIVVENRIGALNQAFLTVETARASGARIAGIVFNQANKTPYGIVEKTNPRLFNQLSNVPVWGVIPFVSSKPGKEEWGFMEKYLKKGLVRLNGVLKSL